MARTQSRENLFVGNYEETSVVITIYKEGKETRVGFIVY